MCSLRGGGDEGLPAVIGHGVCIFSQGKCCVLRAEALLVHSHLFIHPLPLAALINWARDQTVMEKAFTSIEYGPF